ncbi:hypothetical protein [Priestia flexa]|nr:hypothetical protein [Priestia flexa]
MGFKIGMIKLGEIITLKRGYDLPLKNEIKEVILFCRPAVLAII